MMNNQEAMRLVVEGHKMRRDGHKKIAEGYKLLGGALELDRPHTKQSADRHFEACKMISDGNVLLSKAEDAFARALIETIEGACS